ncbi:uncharacterized protein EI90DRAFT_621701 [Cantharellus anzutake]|uniref:uncharacterized protein n=1 Tax=Cantharellus anzutake TaxID=1750568 RepID=UPI001905811F|nr:uncharacterized protein EI90DRAFT_621701 [Cantharellus anzutake]KAF8333071.1 hypothetical protein EI90DRAFT_621701 [Cantharellus anzutake]
MAYGRDEGTEQPSTPPRTPRVNPRYPVAKPITSPSPALSVSQLGNSPWNGGSILFDSDQSEVGKANGADLVLQAGRNSRNTFGSIRLSTPTRSNSEHSLGPHEILASSEPPVAAPERPLSHENSEPGEQNSRRASHASKRASEASHVSSIYPFSPPGLLANISNPTSPEPNIKPRNSSEVEDKDHAVTLKDGGAPVVAAPGVSPASSSVPRHTTSKDIRPSASTSVSIQGPVFSIKRKPPPSVDDYSKAEGTRGRESGVEPILEHPFRLAAASSSTHNPPVLAPSSSLGPTLASSLSPSNRAPRNQVLKPRTTTTAPALKLRPKTSAGERRKIPLSAMPLNDKTCLPAFNAPQAQRIYHPHSGNLVGASNKLSTSTSSSVTSLSSPDEPSHVAARDFIIFIHIDQERFREVSPAFIFHRFQKGDRLPGSNGGDVQEKPENFLGRAIVQDQKAKSDRSDSIGLVGSSSRGTHARLAESSRSVLVEYKMSGTDSFCFHHSVSLTIQKLGLLISHHHRR